MSSERITGVVLTCDGRRLIRQCLDSLLFCDKILVVDSGSTDGTPEIAREYGATVLFRSWEGFASQFTYAHSQVDTEWFFILDQDEICPPALAKMIRATVRASQSTPVAFSVARKSWYFDRFLKHSGSYPDHILRLFRTGKVEFYQDAHIHYRPLGPTGHLGGSETDLIHYPYTSFQHQLAKINVYAQQGADHLRQNGQPGGILQGLGHAVARFLRLFILKRGFLDGRAGFLFAAHGSFYAFSKYIRIVQSHWGEPFDQR